MSHTTFGTLGLTMTTTVIVVVVELVRSPGGG